MDDFWSFLAMQRETIPEPVDSYEDRFRFAVESLTPRARIEYRNEYLLALQKLNKMRLWEACSLLQGSPCGDSSFRDFRNWIIWQGDEITEVMAKNPDDLMSLSEDGLALVDPFIESLSLILGNERDTLKEILSESLDENWSWQDSSLESIAFHLPRMWARYGKSFLWELPAQPASQEAVVVGLGTLKIGDKIRHRFGYGVGTITNIPVKGRSIAVIEFMDQQRTMDVTADVFERVE